MTAGAGHVVHFYERVDTLALAAADFLGAGLAELGGAAIVIATPAHASAIARVLTAAGIDVEAGRDEGLYVELDAEDLLASYMVDGRPDPSLCELALFPMLTEMGAGNRPLRVYGEMVDLLWQAGNARAAHELERLWNSFGAGASFALFCGYDSNSVGGPKRARTAIAEHHELVLTAPTEQVVPDEISRGFEPTPFASHAARQFTLEVLRSWGHTQLLPEAELVVSELATNAVVHTGQRFRVALSRLDERGVRLAVSDRSIQQPALRVGVARYATSGRGIRIVAAIATHWGVHLRPDGKTVWAELAARTGV